MKKLSKIVALLLAGAMAMVMLTAMQRLIPALREPLCLMLTPMLVLIRSTQHLLCMQTTRLLVL